MKKKFTARQSAFIKEYPIDHIAKAAAIRAGYSKKTAKSQGQRLLTNVDIKEAIDKLEQQQAEECGIDAKVLKKRAYELAKADMQGRAEEQMTLSEQARYMDMCFKVTGSYTEKLELAGKIIINVEITDE